MFLLLATQICQRAVGAPPPCRIFVAAFEETQVHGEVVALDPEGFGAISKSKGTCLVTLASY